MRVLLVLIVAAVATPVALAWDWSGFQTPSRNIVCNHSGSQVDCVVFSASPTCQKTWSLKRSGPASFRCLYANIGTEVPVLGYGRSWTRSGIRCVSRRSGLTCTNAAGHGFALSRALQRRF
jgi:Family of unknown function (DUF6636)